MKEFKNWIIHQDVQIDTVPKKFEEHYQFLYNFQEDYSKHFWPEHLSACESVLNSNLDILKESEHRYVRSVSRLTRQYWQREKITVDIVYVGIASKENLRESPYSTLRPTHVIMNAYGSNNVLGNWIELLYHESSHHLVLSQTYFVAGTIIDILEVQNKVLIRDLGHAYLYYLTGKLTQELLQSSGIDYGSTYMERTGVFSNYFPYLDEYLSAYMRREISLHDATKKIIEAIETDN